jgi:hypothetical protein
MFGSLMWCFASLKKNGSAGEVRISQEFGAVQACELFDPLRSSALLPFPILCNAVTVLLM